MIAGLPFVCPLPLEAAVRAAYAAPPRAYHSFSHVEEVLGHMAVVPAWNDAVAVSLAILFHDAVYEAGKPGNEARSAELARTLIARELPQHVARIERVSELIMLTAQHGRLERHAVDEEAALFLDCDMAVLGSDAARYAEYERAIAEEYCALSPELFRAGRASFLRSLLAKPHIYLSPFFERRLDARARANLAKALRELETVSASEDGSAG